MQVADIGRTIQAQLHFAASANRARQATRERVMKIAKTENTSVEHRVWCDKCCIRIAESEERTLIGEKAYHVQCYAKLKPGPKKKRG